MSQLVRRIVVSLLAASLAFNPAFAAGMDAAAGVGPFSGPAPVFAEQAMACVAAPYLHALDRMGEIVRGWAWKLVVPEMGHHGIWIGRAAAVVALLAVAEMYTGLAPAQMGRAVKRIHDNVELIANGKASEADRALAEKDLLAVINTPGGQDRFIEMVRVNGHFSVLAGNWMENANPSTIQDCVNVRESALGVLLDTKDSQVILAMADALLRQVLNQIKLDPAIDPRSLAGTVFKQINNDLKGTLRRTKLRALLEQSNDDIAGQNLTPKQSQFLTRFMTLLSPAAGRPRRAGYDPTHSRSSTVLAAAA